MAAIELGTNSFVSEFELYEYTVVRLNAVDLLGDSQFNNALFLATRLIDQLEFIGQPTDPEQPLQWPRTGVTNRNGQPIASNVIPGKIKDANCELAYFLLNHDITDPVQYRQIYKLSSARVGESESSYRTMKEGPLPDYVMSLLKPYLIEQPQYSAKLIP